MSRKILSLVCILCFTGATMVFAGGRQEGAHAAGVYQYDASDWDAVMEAARKEGKVTVYATTSRIHAAVEKFTQETGIQVEATRLSEVELVERVYQESRSGVNQVDLVLIEDYPSMKELLVDNGYLVNFIPPSAQRSVPSQYHDPLTFAYVSRVIGYNTEKHGDDPFESIWDLTLPEYRGRVMVRDLAITGEHQNAFTELMRRADILEADYERRFGRPLEMVESNAGLEFLRRLVENDIILMTSDTRIAEAVGQRDQDDPPYGFFYVFSKHRDIPRLNLALDFSENINPLIGYYYGLYIQLAGAPQNPNAAMALANYLMTPEGFQPWINDVGIYSMSTEIGVHEDDMPWEWWKDRLWTYDPTFAAENRGVILDAWLRFVQQ
ncbi:ABC transporter substrate-binding protein [Alkalispirochaeta alkalica]|uniref:ABC transporter substrate-binding protein n=1 Tax=Alkalispirochaeta alkalica TaxID=46356 RepID=UPI000362F908|nr:substrate-binding domain-containing protein [Alkalispirochaeta alkalica]